jgi:hypothetical protein
VQSRKSVTRVSASSVHRARQTCVTSGKQYKLGEHLLEQISRHTYIFRVIERLFRRIKIWAIAGRRVHKRSEVVLACPTRPVHFRHWLPTKVSAMIDDFTAAALRWIKFVRVLYSLRRVTSAVP